MTPSRVRIDLGTAGAPPSSTAPSRKTRVPRPTAGERLAAPKGGRAPQIPPLPAGEGWGEGEAWCKSKRHGKVLRLHPHPEGEETARGALRFFEHQDTSIPEPTSALLRHMMLHPAPSRTRSLVKFLPLDFRAGDPDKKLTFIGQGPREAQFVIRVPRSVRNQVGE